MSMDSRASFLGGAGLSQNLTGGTAPGESKMGAARWATVTQIEPLRVRLDGESLELPFTPDSLVTGLEVGKRVWVQQYSKSVIVLGVSSNVTTHIPPVPVADVRVPLTPLGVSAYAEIDQTASGDQFGRIIVSWEPVDESTTGDVITPDQVEYRVRWRENVAGSTQYWTPWVPNSVATIEPLTNGKTYAMAVQAMVSASGLMSELTPEVVVAVASDVTPPPVPTAPDLTSDTLMVTITWDGQLVGLPVPLDFHHLDVEVNGSLAGQITHPGGPLIWGPGVRGANTTVRFRSVDKAGNFSAWSASSAIQVRSVLDDTELDVLLDDLDTEVGQAAADAAQAMTDAANAAGLASQASLDATDAFNAAADAEQAALDAAGLAGTKGKIIYGTTAPTGDDAAVQNLWIDTTNGANTPKRWTGSAWVAVTDKVATDAAAAAAAAQQAATDAAALANSNIKTSVIEYAAAPSDTVAPTTGWTTTQPARTPGTFVWMRTTITRGDNTTATTGATLLAGNTGLIGSELAINGNGVMGSNYNFSAFNYDKTDTPVGAVGVFLSTLGTQMAAWMDKAMPYDPMRAYKFSFDAKQMGTAPNAKFYGFFTFLTSWGHVIQTGDFMYTSGTTTTLAAPLNPGDTTVTLTSSANWYGSAAKPANAATYLRGIIFWDYTDPNGKLWPVNSFSRNWNYDLYNDGGLVGNVITLKVPWAGPAKPAGTSVSNSSAAGTFIYMPSATNAVVPQTWTRYSNIYPATASWPQNTGLPWNWPVNPLGQGVPPPQAAALIRAGWLLNYGAPAGSQHAIANVSVSDAAAAADFALAAQATATAAIKDSVNEYAVNSSETVAPASGWSTVQPARTPGTFVWFRTKVTKGDNSTVTSSPALLTGNTGATGSPGTPGESLYTWVKYADTPTTGMSDSPTGKAYIGIAVNKTTATESSAYGDYTWSFIQGSQGVPGAPGEDGVTLYTWIKYASDANGTGLSDDPTGKTYLGLAYNKTTAVESTVPGDYSWSLIQGPQGMPGPATYTWLKYADSPTTGMSDSPTGKTYMGLAHNKNTAVESSVYSDYTWSLIQGAQGVPGTPGADGTTTYTWVKYGDSAAGAGLSDSPTGKTYIGLAFNKTTATESTNAADYTWSLIQGPQGIPGSTLYTWLKYADSPTSGMSDDPTGKTYMGLAYNKTITTESVAYSDYTWSLIKGTDGVPGTPGADGVTYYTWIKYGTSAAGAGISDDPTGKSYIGIAYNKTTATESVNPGDYTWSLIQGPQGLQGDQGVPGPTLYTWIKYADSPTTGMSDDPTGKTYMGIAYNKLSATESSTYTDYAWSLIQGTQGIQGPPGDDGAPTYTWVKYATSAAGAGLSDSPVGMTYLGLAYNKTTAVESTNPSDYQWSLIQGPQGPQGDPGTPGAVVTLTATTQVLTSPSGGGATSPATSVVTGTALNTTIDAWTYSVDGGAFSATVPAGVSRTGNVVTITGSTMTARTITVKMANTATGAADTLTVAKVLDGATGSPGSPGTAGADAITALLTNESHTFPGSTSAALAGSTTTTVIAYKAAVAQTITVGTITGQVTGLTTSIASNGTTAPVITVTVTTALVTRSGKLTIPLTIDGKAFTKEFSWSVAYTGAQGATGNTGATGTSVASITPFWLQQPVAEAAPATPTGATPPNDPVGGQAWTTTQPTYVSGTKVYRTERVTYANPTAYAYTPPVEDQAYALAALAYVSANGKNAVIRSTSPASGTTNPSTGQALIAGDLWWQWDNLTDRRVIGQWVWSGSAWQTSFINHQVIATLDANKITVGTLSADRIGTLSITSAKIAAGAITADKMVITGENLILDPLFLSDYWAGPNGSVVASAGRLGGNGYQIVANGTAKSTYMGGLTDATRALAVQPGDYKLSVWVKSSVALTGANQVTVNIATSTALGTAPNVYNALTVTPLNAASVGGASVLANAAAVLANTWVLLEGTFTVPNTVARMTFGLLTQSTTPAGTVTFSELTLKARAGADLIVDGAIVAGKLASDAVVAGNIAAGAVQADSIAAGAIDGMTISGADIWSPNAGASTRVHVGGSKIEVYRGGELPNVLIGGTSADELQLYSGDGENREVLAGFDGTGDGTANTMKITAPGGLTVDGLNITDMIDALPKGLIARQRLTSGGTLNSALYGTSTGELGLIEMGFLCVKGRSYRVRFAGFVYGATAQVQTMRFRATYGTNPAAPTTTSLQLQSEAIDVPASGTRPFKLEVIVDGRDNPGDYLYRVLLTGSTNGTSGRLNHGDTYPANFTVEDLGRFDERGDGALNNGGGTTYGGTAPPAGSSNQPKQTYTTTWRASAIKTFKLGSGYENPTASGLPMYSGNYNGDQRASWVLFGGGAISSSHSSEIGKTMPVAMNNGSGVTVTKAIYGMRCTHTYYSGGANVQVSWHGSTSYPATIPAAGSSPVTSLWKPGVSSRVVPSAQWTGLATGATRGFIIGGNSGQANLSSYAQHSSVFADTYLTITYTK